MRSVIAGMLAAAAMLGGCANVAVPPIEGVVWQIDNEHTDPRGDWLAQIGWSLDYGNDLLVDRQSWWTQRYYAEIGRYLQQGINYGLASAMVGRSYKVSADGRTVAFPHLFAGVEYTTDDPVDKTAAGIGPGISVRRWFREDVYDAPRSYFDLTLQYRARITGDDRMKGLYLNGLLSY